jgi:hypothetical protein
VPEFVIVRSVEKQEDVFSVICDLVLPVIDYGVIIQQKERRLKI